MPSQTRARWKPLLAAAATAVAAIAGWQTAMPAAAAVTHYVATDGSDANPGTQVAPMRTLDAAVRSARSGDTIVLRGGYYHESVQVFDKEVHIRSADGERAVLDGSVDLDDWRQSNGLWFSANWTRQFPRLNQSPVDPTKQVAGRADEMFIEGRPLTQVTSRAEVTAGTFFHDESADRLWIADNPTGKSVRAAALEWALYFNRAHNSSLTDVTVRRYATPFNMAGTIRGHADNLVFDGVEVQHNAYTGLSITGNNIRVSNSMFRENGYLGVSGYATTNFMFDNNGVIGNNRNGFDPRHSAGGIKLTESSNLAFIDNYVADNAGPGIWTDLGSYNIDVVGNLVERNLRSGIEMELSGQVDVVDNVSIDNGEAGIWILESNNVNVYNNAAHDNVRDIYVMEGPRTSPTSNQVVRWDTDRVAIYNNVVGGGRQAIGRYDAYLQVDDWTENRSAASMRVTSDYNAFWKPSSSNVANIVRWARWPQSLAISTALPSHNSQSGQDGHSVESGAGSNPYATDAQHHDYRSRSGTPAGLALPGPVAGLVGLSAGARPAIGPVTAAREITEVGAPPPPETPPVTTTTTAPTTTTTAPTPTPTTAPPTTTPTSTTPTSTTPTPPTTPTTVPATTTTTIAPTPGPTPGPTPSPGPSGSVIRFPAEQMLDTNSNGRTVDNTYRAIGRWPGGSTFSTRVGGRGSVPADADGVLVTVTATAGSITVFPCDGNRPSNPTLIVPSGQTFGMTTLAVNLSQSGYVCTHTTASTHLTATATAYFTDDVVYLDRTRVLDMRPNGSTADRIYRRIGTWPANSTFTLPIAGRAGVPRGTHAASLALRVVGVEGNGTVTMFPCNQGRGGQPSVAVRTGSTAWLNDVVTLDNAGQVCIHTTVPAQFIVDTMGYLN